MNKKAQFFLIAALIISAVILTLGRKYASGSAPEESTLVYDLSDEIYYETSQVIDNGAFQGKSEDEISAEISTLAKYYADSNPDSDIVVLYGNSEKIKEVSYQNSLDQKVQVRDVLDQGLSKQGSAVKNIEKDSQNIAVDIEFLDKVNSEEMGKKIKIRKNFKIQKGQNFYLVIRKKVDNEQVIFSR